MTHDPVILGEVAELVSSHEQQAAGFGLSKQTQPGLQRRAQTKQTSGVHRSFVTHLHGPERLNKNCSGHRLSRRDAGHSAFLEKTIVINPLKKGNSNSDLFEASKLTSIHRLNLPLSPLQPDNCLASTGAKQTTAVYSSANLPQLES